MEKSQKIILSILILLSAGIFCIFIIPNRAGSENIQMVEIFEPDESVPLPYLFAMIKPGETFKQTLINFAFYEYYFYGYPHFALSGLVLLPVQWKGRLQDTPLVMAALRQMISVLPMLASILLLVYLQTDFRSYKAVVLFLLLASVPAVVQNNLWWHPDSLAIMFAMLVIFFLYRDDLRLGLNFYLAGAMCGLSAGTKGIGFYFFAATAVILLLAMAAAYLLANPILIYASVRRDYFHVMSEQARLLSSGYEVYYPKGLAAAWRGLRENFGFALFYLAASGACLWGIIRSEKRLLYILILSWVLPISVSVISLFHFKFQYWLPAALPLFSCLVVALPEVENLKLPALKARGSTWLRLGVTLILVVQFAAYLGIDTRRYTSALRKADSNPSIQFYHQARQSLQPLPEDEPYFVYHDVLIYAPHTPGWVTEAIFETLDYQFITDRDYDVLLLMQQRIADYTNPNVVGIDAQHFARSKLFYTDAERGQLDGYVLLHRDAFGLIYVKNTLYQKYFSIQP
jgi:hypothetical protein